MTELQREIDIAASPEAVYDVVADPNCLGDWVTIQEELEEAPPGDLEAGSKLRQRMRVAGQRFRLSWTVVEADKPNRIVWDGRGPMGSTAKAVYELSGNGNGGTSFSYMNQYELPGGVAGRIAGRAIRAASGREADRTLKRLKKLVESRAG
jgi:carbon monoxide dehydrogenase subunit G